MCAESTPVTVQGRGGVARFEAGPGETLLEAALRQGADVPYSCASGSCGLCKARIVEGSVERLWPEAPGYGRKLREDEALLCQCAATGTGGAVALTLAGASGALAPVESRPGRYGATILATRPLGEGLLEVECRLDRPLRHAAGQFGLFYFPGLDGGRAFSFAAPPTPDGSEHVLLVVKRKPGGPATERLFGQDAAGSRIEMFGPLGHATFEPGREGDLLCVAGGSGLSLGLAIMGQAALAGHFRHHRGTLVIGLRRPEDLTSLAPLGAMAEAAGPGLRILVALSDEGACPPPGWAGGGVTVVAGLAHEALRAAMAGDYAGHTAYVAGPPPMVQAVQRLLLTEGRLPARDIRCDTFY